MRHLPPQYHFSRRAGRKPPRRPPEKGPDGVPRPDFIFKLCDGRALWYAAAIIFISLEASHEGFSVLSDCGRASAAFCRRTYTWFSPVRARMGSRYASWLNAV